MPKNQRLAESDNVKGMSLLNWCRSKMFSKEEFTGNLFQESKKKKTLKMCCGRNLKNQAVGLRLELKFKTNLTRAEHNYSNVVSSQIFKWADKNGAFRK